MIEFQYVFIIIIEIHFFYLMCNTSNKKFNHFINNKNNNIIIFI